MSELNGEIGRMRVEINDKADDNAAYLSYEKKAESIAKELKVV
jgi:hypothetical protein